LGISAILILYNHIRKLEMSDLKSKLPDLKELSSMSCKLYNGLKNSVTEIIHDYKEKRADLDKAEETKVTTTTVTSVEAEKPVVTEEKK
jgi:hypothetical protein